MGEIPHLYAVHFFIRIRTSIRIPIGDAIWGNSTAKRRALLKRRGIPVTGLCLAGQACAAAAAKDPVLWVFCSTAGTFDRCAGF